MKKIKRTVYFDILNIIAIISVTALHCNGIVHTNLSVQEYGPQV